MRRSKHFNLPELTEHQRNLIVGSLLGDGWLQKSKFGNSCFRKRHKKSCYVDWMLGELTLYGSSVNAIKSKQRRKRTEEGKVISEIVPEYIVGHEITSVSHPVFTELRHKWYPNDIKMPPRDLVLNPEILATWYVDDGCNTIKYRSCYIATDGFSFDDVEFLCYRLNTDLSFTTHPTKHSNRHNIRFYGDDYERLLELVTPLVIWKDFLYKIHYEPLKRRKNLTEEERAEINMLLNQNATYEDISNKYGIKVSSLYKMKRSLLRNVNNLSHQCGEN